MKSQIIAQPGFATSSNETAPGYVMLEFFSDEGKFRVLLDPDQAKYVAEAILSSRAKYLNEGLEQ